MSRFARARSRAAAGLLLLALVGAGVVPTPALASTATPSPQPSATGAEGSTDPGAATDSTPRTWAVVPADEDGPDGRGQLDYTLEPGSRVEDFVAVRNLGEEPLTVDLYVQDAGQTPESAFAVQTPEETPQRVGTWVRLSADEVEVPPRDAVVVPFVIDLPADAEPGDHAGGILAVSVIDQEDGPSVSYAAGTRVYVRVAGPVQPALEADSLRGTYEGSLGPISTGDLTADVTLVNTGNVRLDPTSVVEVRSLFGLWTGTLPLTDVAEILPDGATATTGELQGVPPLGPYWLTVTTTGALSRDQDITDAVVTTSPTVMVWAVPWVLLGVLALLLLAGIVAWRNLRKRRKAAEAELAAELGDDDETQDGDASDGEASDGPVSDDDGEASSETDRDVPADVDGDGTEDVPAPAKPSKN